MSGSANDLLMGGKVKSAKLKEVGDAVTGVITEEPTRQQMRDYDDDSLLWLDEEKTQPREQVRVVLQTDQRDPAVEDDDGIRAVYLKGQLRVATASAVRLARRKGLDVGGTLAITVTGTEPVVGKKGKPMNDKKLHSVRYTPPSASFSVEPAAEAAIASGLGGREIVTLDGVPTDITDYSPPMKEAARRMAAGTASTPKDEPPF